MPTLEYKINLEDLFDIKVSVDIEEPEYKVEFEQYIKRQSNTLSTHKEFKKFGKKYHRTRAEMGEKKEWMMFNLFWFYNILQGFIYQEKDKLEKKNVTYF